MYGYNKHSDDNNKDNSSRIDKKFLDALSGFIQSVELEMDIILPGFTSLQFLSYYNIIDHIISQKLSKNIIIKILCSLDEDSGKLTKQLVPFIGYKSIKLSLPKTSSNSLLFIRDKRDIFSFSVQQNDKENKGSDTIFYVNDWSYSKNFSTVRNTLYCFDIIWQEKEVYNKIIREKRHSELLFDVISHDIGNYYQIIRSSLELVISLFEKNNNNSTNSLFQNTERILLLLTTATNALNKSQSLVDNIRRLERLYAQKDLKLILKNLPDVINNAYTTVEQTLYDNNPQGKRIRFSVRVVEDHHPTDINVIAEDLLEEIFINLFSNSVKYTDS